MKKIKPYLPDLNLVTVGTLTDSIAAELVKNTLNEYELDCLLDGRGQAGMTGALAIAIMVRQQDATQAREIMEQHFPQLFGSK